MRLVSLGRSCETAFQIRMHTPKVDADFFDWLITPFDGLMMALETDFADLLEPGDLYLQDDRNFVNNRVTGIQYGHVFARDANTHMHPDNFLDDLGRVSSIFSHLKNKFLTNALGNKPLGFVRRQLDPAQAQTLETHFARRFPHLPFIIVGVNAVSQGLRELGRDRIVELVVPESGPDGLGHPEPWAAALVEAGLTGQPYAKTKDEVFHRLMVHMTGDVQTLVDEARLA